MELGRQEGTRQARISREILQLRGPKLQLRSDRAHAAFNQLEPNGSGGTNTVTTLLLVGAECVFRCSMCDLWKYTLDGPTPPGSLIVQIEQALESLPLGEWIKLYNASNFFDPRSVPEDDMTAIARLCNSFERVIVENHPKLLRTVIVDFSEQIEGRLEIAMGLETVHPEAFRMLNKGMVLDDFRRASDWLIGRNIDVRAFVLLQPPGTRSKESVEWAHRSIDYAIDCGARHVSVIPVRRGNGWVDELIRSGRYQLPAAGQLEQVLEESLVRVRGKCIVTVDLWDWTMLRGHCESCSKMRLQRLDRMNQNQNCEPAMVFTDCRCNEPMVGALDRMGTSE